MAVIYKEQAITNPQIPDMQQTLDTSGINAYQQKLQQTYDKQVQTYNTQQYNIANSAIQDAYIQFNDKPEEFEKASISAIDGIAKTLRTDEDKVEFMAQAELAMSPIKLRVANNFTNKVQKDYRETQAVNANFTLNMVKESLPLLAIDPNASGEVRSNLGKLKAMAEEKDNNGYVLNASERAKINDLITYDKYYGAIGYADQLKGQGDKDALIAKYTEYKNDKQGTMKSLGLTEEKYSELLTAYKVGEADGSSVSRTQAEVGIKTDILGLDIKKVEDGSGYEANDMQGLFGTINTLDEAFKNNQVSKTFYSTNMPKLKSTYYNMAKSEALYKPMVKERFGWIPDKKMDTVGTNIIDYVEKFTTGLINGTNSDTKRYDLTLQLSNKAKEKGIDPNSTNTQDITTFNNMVHKELPTIIRQVYKDTTIHMTDDEIRKRYPDIIKKEKKKNAVKKADAVLNIGDNKALGNIING